MESYSVALYGSIGTKAVVVGWNKFLEKVLLTAVKVGTYLIFYDEDVKRLCWQHKAQRR